MKYVEKQEGDESYDPFASMSDVHIQNFYGDASFEVDSPTCSGTIADCNYADDIVKAYESYGVWNIGSNSVEAADW